MSRHRPSLLSRQAFLRVLGTGAALAAAGLPGGCASQPRRPPATGRIMTVLGPLPAATAGMTLPHEHITTDFLGAEKAPGPRYPQRVALTTILPELARLRASGCSTLVECTPQYIGRDPVLLVLLAKASGLNIVTNTGYYGAADNKFLPRHAFTEPADALAERWLREWQHGIGDTGVRPGFIKLGTGSGPLSALHRKLVQAAALVHRDSGMPIAMHSGDGAAARDGLDTLETAGVPADAFIWVHAQNDAGPIQLELAARGAWISLDGVNLAHRNLERYRNMLLALKNAGHLQHVLISHDDGWAVEGESLANAPLKLFGNGNPRPYETLFTRLLPDLRQAGFTRGDLNTLTRSNPAHALALRSANS